MKKLVKYMMALALCIFLLQAGNTSLYAMTAEEKELFDSLGVEYVLDENGDFKQFVVDENSPRHFKFQNTVDIMKKYGWGPQRTYASVGKYQIKASYVEPDEDGIYGCEFLIYLDTEDPHENGILLAVMNTMNAYADSDDNFIAFAYAGYPEYEAEEAFCYTKGNLDLNERECNTWYDYYRDESGNFVLTDGNDGYSSYEYDKDGNVTERIDWVERVVYDGNNQPVEKIINVNAISAGVGIPYEIYDEVAKMMEEHNGNLYEQVAQGSWQMIPEIEQYITDYEKAKELGISIEEYQAVREKCPGNGPWIEEAIRDSILNELQTERTEVLAEVAPMPEHVLPAEVTERGIAEILEKLINDHRMKNGKEALDNSDTVLRQVAELRAEECAYYFDHDRPMLGNAKGFGVGENIVLCGVAGYTSNWEIANRLFELWHGSVGHNTNMLHSDYLKGSVGIKLVLRNGTPVVVASNNFASYDYENNISDDIRGRLEAGAQTPDRYESSRDYANKLHSLVLGGTAPRPTPEGDTDVNPGGTEDFQLEIGGSNMIWPTYDHVYMNIDVVDASGNRFKLPDGTEWVTAEAHMGIVDMAQSESGETYEVYQGIIRFIDASGVPHQIYIVDESFLDDTGMIAYINNITQNPIVLTESSVTGEGLFPEGFEGFATNTCYYIANGGSYRAF